MTDPDRAFTAELAAALADAGGMTSTVRCDTEGCLWAIHTRDPEAARSAYGEHLRSDARHTGREWIDRDGQLWRGLERVDEETVP